MIIGIIAINPGMGMLFRVNAMVDEVNISSFSDFCNYLCCHNIIAHNAKSSANVEF